MKRAGVLLAILLAAAAVASDQVLKAGDTLPPLGLRDQHNVPAAIDDGTRLVLFSREMGASDFVEEALDQDGAEMLASANAVFIADISGMPSIITRIFALPSLRKRAYRMVLDRDGNATAELPAQDDRVTIIHLDKRSIVRVEYADSSEKVAEALRSAASQAAGRD